VWQAQIAVPCEGPGFQKISAAWIYANAFCVVFVVYQEPATVQPYNFISALHLPF